jgi:hypothetical protein
MMQKRRLQEPTKPKFEEVASRSISPSLSLSGEQKEKKNFIRLVK